MNWNEIFEYKDGFLYWKVKPCIRTNIGDLAGRVTSGGYLQVGYKKKYYMVHTIIWKMHNGDIPEGLVVDHKDRNSFNNKIENLRLCTLQQNTYNRAMSNKLGVKGVRKEHKKYRASITHNGIQIHLGQFSSLEEASTAYEIKAKELHGEFYYKGA
jgi:hypothetical protein